MYYCNSAQLFYYVLLTGNFNTVILKKNTRKVTTIDNVDYEADTIAPVTYGDDVDFNRPYAWGGHEVPEAVVKKCKEWLQHHYEEKEKDKLDVLGKNYSLPWTWLGMEGGNKGVLEPPPWAYEPINIGLPYYCYLPPPTRLCSKKKEQRYAYNPYTEKCVKFEYGGCNGNQNNFQDIKQCEKWCAINI